MRNLLQGFFVPEQEAEAYPLNTEGFRLAFKRLPVLEGARLMLRAPRISDADDLFTYARDELNCRYVLWDAHQSVAQSRDALRGLIYRNRRGYPATFAIELTAQQRMIGTIGFQDIDVRNRCAQVGYSIARRLWNHGLATEALLLLLPYAFDTLGLNRLEATHDVLNPASGRVLRKAGFREEGMARGSMLLKGRMADMAQYAILREDWLLTKGGYPHETD